MSRRCFLCFLLVISLAIPVRAEPIRWVDFDVPYTSLEYAMERDIETFDWEIHVS